MTTQAAEYLSFEDHYAVYRPVGKFSFDRIVLMINNALRYCCDNEIRGLLVDITEVTGFPPPSIAQRYFFGTTWAETAAGKVHLALIAQPDIIDPEKTGAIVANNLGLHSDVFTNRSDAVDWLHSFVKK